MNLGPSSLDAFREFDLKEDRRLEEVWQRVKGGCLDFVVLKFSAGVLTFTADADTDMVEVRHEEAEAFDFSGLIRASDLTPWSSLIGQSFGWGWVAINQQGYQDGVLLSFGGLQPSVLIVAAASSLRAYGVKDLTHGTAL